MKIHAKKIGDEWFVNGKHSSLLTGIELKFYYEILVAEELKSVSKEITTENYNG